MVIKTGVYRVSVNNKILAYIGSDYGVDVSDSVITFSPFKELDIDLEGDTVYLKKDIIGYVFSKSPIITSLFSEKGVLANKVFCADIVFDSLVDKENKMEEKILYDVFDGATLIGTKMELDVALCLIDGYVRKYKDELVGISLIPSDKNK